MAKQPESQSFMDMFAKFGKELKMPKVDVDAILDHHRKNLEALEKSAKATAAGASSIMARQREMLEESLHEISEMAQSYRAPGMPKDMIAKLHGEVVKALRHPDTQRMLADQGATKSLTSVYTVGSNLRVTELITYTNGVPQVNVRYGIENVSLTPTSLRAGAGQ